MMDRSPGGQQFIPLPEKRPMSGLFGNPLAQLVLQNCVFSPTKRCG